MKTPILEIEKILLEEIKAYASLYELEEKKTGAIMNRDGKLLESISQEQEIYLSRLDSLEKKRKKCIESHVHKGHVQKSNDDITLKDVTVLMDENSSTMILGLGMELKRILQKLDLLYKTNRKLIEDNIEFFSRIVSGLKDSASVITGYCEKGVDRAKINNSLLFNKTA